MSTLVSEIIVQAFREGNFIAVGETTTAEELVEAVPRLNNYISSLLGIELGEGFRDWYVPQVWNPEAPTRFPLTPSGDGEDTSAEPYQYLVPNVRILSKVTGVRTLYFPAAPQDGARMNFLDMGNTAIVTLDGNGRFIEGAATLAVPVAIPPDPSPVHGRRWLYRADLGDWKKITTLLSTDEVPLPEEFDDLLVTGLAIRLAPRFQVKIDETVIARNGDMLARLKKRYKQTERQPSSAELRQIMAGQRDI